MRRAAFIMVCLFEVSRDCCDHCIKAKSTRDNVVDMAKYMDQRVRVKFQGGREGNCRIIDILFDNSNLVDGIMKGFDKLDNIVLDDCLEYLRGRTSITVDMSSNHSGFRKQYRSRGYIPCY